MPWSLTIYYIFSKQSIIPKKIKTKSILPTVLTYYFIGSIISWMVLLPYQTFSLSFRLLLVVDFPRIITAIIVNLIIFVILF